MDISELKQRKKALKLTTAELAYLAELPVSTVSKIMTGETRNPTYATIEKIDKALFHEEMLHRLSEYIRYLQEYMRSNPELEVDQIKFEKSYRKEKNLGNDPIPFAIREGDEDGNLAPMRDTRATVALMHEIGEDKTLELMDGHIIYNEAPGIGHQRLVQRLGKAIDAFIEANKGKCQMFNVGVNVRLDEDDYTMLIPDIAVACEPDIIDENGINGAPDWIIEVVSKSTRRRDYNDKMHKYMHAGVREYWIVDPDKEKVTTYIEGEPMMAYIYSFEDDIPVYIYDGKLKIRIKDNM
ncbi:Uma2 family endonuclease [Butyrivibrio sp. VCB2006]|uniref:Uma2 family endonuclease n=1 Tax=Butyrivibrio sp. VCB2006 TaxID=1280679 RepID=UPI0004061518|nr:Uma2 family endonuclease [Butyrivibrio sp. VCB2006]